MSDDDGVLARPGGDGELDLRVGGGELGEERLDEAAARYLSAYRAHNREGLSFHSLHSPGAACPVAVVQVHLLALEDEGADAILRPLGTEHAWLMST